MPKSTFEAEFKAFVEYFGGEVVPEEYNVVAELKCSVVDQTAENTRKLAEIIKQRRAVPAPEAGPNIHLLLSPQCARAESVRIC